MWLARDFLRTAGRPIDIPPCGCSTTDCPPIKTEENEMTTTPDAAERERIARAIEALVIDLDRHDGYTTAIRDAAAVARQHTAASASGSKSRVRLGDTCGPEHTYRDACQYAEETK